MEPKDVSRHKPEIVVDHDDIPQWTKADFDRALLHPPGPIKKRVTLRLNTAVLKWFEDQGPGYQSRINKVLEHFVRKHQWTQT